MALVRKSGKQTLRHCLKVRDLTYLPTSDPIEACAIANVLASRRLSNDPVYLGSVKSNLG